MPKIEEQIKELRKDLKPKKIPIKEIDNEVEIPKESEEEIEIRANTIWAVEFMRQALAKKEESVTAIGINDHLWLMTQEKKEEFEPYHLTRTTAY